MILHPYVSAQAPSCLSGYEWSFNSLGQSPCNMTEALGGVCINGAFTLDPLPPGNVYVGPSPVNATSCQCSTVFYSLLSACANCQNDSFLSWSEYDVNCTSVFIQTFVEPIPPGTKIPHYAYLDVVTNNTFNVSAAESAGGSESTPASQPTSTSALASQPTSTSALASQPTNLNTSATSITTSTTSTPSSKKVNIGAIIGGIVAAFAVIGVAACIIFYKIRSRTPSHSLSASTPSTYNVYTSAGPGPASAKDFIEMQNFTQPTTQALLRG